MATQEEKWNAFVPNIYKLYHDYHEKVWRCTSNDISNHLASLTNFRDLFKDATEWLILLKRSMLSGKTVEQAASKIFIVHNEEQRQKAISWYYSIFPLLHNWEHCEALKIWYANKFEIDETCTPQITGDKQQVLWIKLLPEIHQMFTSLHNEVFAENASDISNISISLNSVRALFSDAIDFFYTIKFEMKNGKTVQQAATNHKKSFSHWATTDKKKAYQNMFEASLPFVTNWEHYDELNAWYQKNHTN